MFPSLSVTKLDKNRKEILRCLEINYLITQRSKKDCAVETTKYFELNNNENIT